ncbi:MAG: YfhO family protein [Bacteroidota bacterium]|nr:YfhO family protein [Bacteroidota bacterium]
MSKNKEHKRVASRTLIPPKYRHAVSIGIIFLSLVVFFHDAIFSGKVFNASDNIASQSFKTFLDEGKQEGIFPLWNPYIFCGMPTFASVMVSPTRVYDLTGTIWGAISHLFTGIVRNEEVTGVIFYYFVFGISMYIFMLHKKKSPLVALFTSLASIYSTYIIIWIMVGHNTKIATICLFPIIVMLIEEMIDNFKWWHGVILVIILHIQLLPSHIQMDFYLYLTLGMYLTYLLVARIAKKEQWVPVVRSGAVFLLALGISLAMSADLYLSILEYNPYSIRGKNPIISTTESAKSKTAAGGLDYDYATSWSFSPGEVLTFVVPSLYGFGTQEYTGPIFKGPTRLPTYWGQMPFTDAPQYMGIVVLALAVLGVYYNRKDRFVHVILVIAIFALFVSFGRTFSLVYDLMYYYFPLFNKFRVPSMILVLVQLIVPILAGYGLQSLFDKGKEHLTADAEKKFKYILGGAAVLIIFGIIARGFFSDLYESFMGSDGMARLLSIFGKQPDSVLSQIRPLMFDFVFGNAMTDYFIMLVLLAGTFGTVYAYRKQMISMTTAGVIIIALAVFDLWRTDTKPMEMYDKQSEASDFATPDYVKAVQADQSLYRVLDTENIRQPSNNLAYYKLQSISGYSGAKPRVYQDMIDVAGLANPAVWTLMNMKYIIADPKEQIPGLPVVFNGRTKKVLLYTQGSERAWFVDSVAVDSGLGILERIKQMSFNPHHVAFVESDPPQNIQAPDTSANVRVKEFRLHDVSFNVAASGNNLLFVSEIYYPKGWNAYIDGTPTKIFKTNYAFRSVIVPQGKHLLEFKFEPTAYPIGRTISLLTNILAWCGTLAVGFIWWNRRKNKDNPAKG